VLLVFTVYSEIAVSQKPFGIGNMFAYTFLLRMADTVISENMFGLLNLRRTLTQTSFIVSILYLF
jgi:hypothetical protein